MILIEDLMYDIFIGLITSIIVAIAGLIFPIIQYFRKRKRKKRITSFFGKNAEQAVISLPVFHAITNDRWDKGVRTSIMKKRILEENTKEMRMKEEELAVYHDKIDVGDYYGFEAVQSLFAKNDMTDVKFKSDEFLVEHGDFQNYPCIIMIGGPGSNQKINEIIKFFPDAAKLFELEGAHDKTLYSWLMKIEIGGNQLKFSVDKHRAIGCIMRIPNPPQPQNYLIGLFGDRSQSTLMICIFLRENIDKLNQIAGDMPFIALVGVTGPALNITKLMHVSTDDRILYENRKEVEKFLVNN